MAVERVDSNGWCRIRRGGQEKIVHGNNFPPTVGDVDVKGLSNQKFYCRVWREEGCGAGAGGGGSSCAHTCVTLLLLQVKCTALWTLQPPYNPW